MCGIVGILDKTNNIVNTLYNSVFYLQHRGQHSSGFIFFSTEKKKTFKSKKIGLINEHFDELQNFSGNMGLTHVRYPTSGNNSRSEIQPFSILKPYGISLVHNGNITNLVSIGIVSKQEAYAKEVLNYGNDYCGDPNNKKMLYLQCSQFFNEKKVREEFEKNCFDNNETNTGKHKCSLNPYRYI